MEDPPNEAFCVTSQMEKLIVQQLEGRGILDHELAVLGAVSIAVGYSRLCALRQGVRVSSRTALRPD